MTIPVGSGGPVGSGDPVGGRDPVVRNDWSTIAVPELGRWRPELPVSVVIPAYRCPASLELTLAALAHQTYPASRLEVVVVDDGSQPPLELPKLRPEHCRLIYPASGWGRANALHAGAEHSDGEIIHWLDADMVVYPDHVEAQARWHHQIPYAVTLGSKRFVDVTPDGPHWPTPDEVADACATGDAGQIFAGLPSEPHDYIEKIIADSDQLRGGDHLAFLVHVGATAALRRELYRAAGGLDRALRLGEDTEFGYRLAQAGAVFVPELRARSWHLGRTHMMRDEERLRRYNRPFLADRMPQPRWLRRGGGTSWAVPLVLVVLEVGEEPLERVRTAVDSVLHSDQSDMAVVLVGPWSSLSTDRVSPLADPRLELRLVAATYGSEPRVRLAESAPETAFPAPYLLRMPATCALAPEAVGRLVEFADRNRLGRLRCGPVELWRTAAQHRAGWVRRGGTVRRGTDTPADPVLADPVLADPVAADLVAAVHGAGTAPAAMIGVADLSGTPAGQLAPGRVVAGPGWHVTSVEVAGFRSLARAAGLVTRLTATRLLGRARRLARRSG